MRLVLAVLALAASVTAQAVTEIIVPSAVPPAGCENSRSGSFQITIQNVTVANASTSTAVASPTPSLSFLRRDAFPVIHPLPLLPRQQSGILALTLTGGMLTDQANRTGYIASNYQFQFDAPPQSGAIYTGGFTLCANGSLAVGGSTIFYQCLSGTFYNLYDRAWAEHCVPVYINAIGGSGSVFSTAPPGLVSTGPSEATIANGGGTQSTSGSVGIGGGASTGIGGGSASATMTTGGGPSQSSAQETAAATSASSDGAAVATGVSLEQKMLGWVVGVVGALAVV